LRLRGIHREGKKDIQEKERRYRERGYKERKKDIQEKERRYREKGI
jgi:hypothetical protein